MLDDLLETAGLKLAWDEPTRTYRSPAARSSYASSSSSALSSASGDDGAGEADTLDERLVRVVGTRGFLALSVSPRHLPCIERRLAAALALTPFSLEAGLIRHMRAVADALGADWNVVVAADAAPAGSADRRRLDQLVRRAVPDWRARSRTHTSRCCSRAPDSWPATASSTPWPMSRRYASAVRRRRRGFSASPRTRR